MSTDEDYSWISSITSKGQDSIPSPFAQHYVPPAHAQDVLRASQGGASSLTFSEGSSGQPTTPQAAPLPETAMPQLQPAIPSGVPAGGYYYPQQHAMMQPQPMMYYAPPQAMPQMVAVQTAQGGYMWMPMPAGAAPPQMGMHQPPAYAHQGGTHQHHHHGGMGAPFGGNRAAPPRYHQQQQHPVSHAQAAPIRGAYNPRGRGGAAPHRAPYHPVVFNSPPIKSPPQTTLTVVKTSSQRGAVGGALKGLVPIDGDDDEFFAPSVPSSVLPAPAEEPREDASVVVSPTSEALASARTIVANMIDAVVQSVDDQPDLGDLPNDNNAEVAVEPNAAEEGEVVNAAMPGVPDICADKMEECDAHDTEGDVTHLQESQEASTEREEPEKPKGPRPPTALGIEHDDRPGALKPTVTPPTPIAATAHPANPVFVIPARCTGKTPEGKTDFKCPYCGHRGFLSEYVLRSHLRAKHTSDASFLVRDSLVQAVVPHLKEFLAVDGPVSGGSASIEEVMSLLPGHIRSDIRDLTHFEAIATMDDDFVVFEYTEEDLVRHHITSDVAVSGELRIALIDVPYVKRDTERSIGTASD